MVSRTVANFLRLFAAWTVFVWVTFIRNISRDHTHGTGFKVVHITLAVISLLFAAATLIVVARERRGRVSEASATSPRREDRPREGQASR